jgi:hypothetical protein
MALVFAGIKLPILALGGLCGIISGLVIYTADKYLCSSADVILDIETPPEHEMNIPEPFRSVVHSDFDNKESARPAPITYKYDVLAGQWDTTALPGQVPESEIRNAPKVAP